MKLVDILARELKVWPQGARWILSDGANGCYADLGITSIDVGIDCSDFDGNPTNAVFEESWQAAADALKVEKVVEWNGEGLPPAGAVCEFQGDCAKCPSDPWHKELHDGVKCTVIAHFKSKSLDLVAFTFVKADGNSELEQSLPGALRPIRTPEQIAKQERSKACDKMYGVILDKIPQDRRNNGSDICEALYDAGYRKFEIVDN